MREFLPEFADLRRDDRRAIRLIRIVGEIVLMIIFRRIKVGKRGDFGDNRFAENVFVG